jgi:DNA recombination protein RmuC
LESGTEQDALLESHSKALKGRIKDLSSKAYQDAIEGEFDHVIMFVPSEAMAAAAFSVDPGLMDYAMTKSVLVTTPVTMLGLLRTVALYWQQHSLAKDAKEIYDVSKEMYRRVATFFEHIQKVGGHLEKAGKSYNDAINSYGTRILPQGRRLEEMKVAETLPKTLPEPKMVETIPLHNDSEE